MAINAYRDTNDSIYVLVTADESQSLARGELPLK